MAAVLDVPVNDCNSAELLARLILEELKSIRKEMKDEMQKLANKFEHVILSNKYDMLLSKIMSDEEYNSHEMRNSDADYEEDEGMSLNYENTEGEAIVLENVDNMMEDKHQQVTKFIVEVQNDAVEENSSYSDEIPEIKENGSADHFIEETNSNRFRNVSKKLVLPLENIPNHTEEEEGLSSDEDTNKSVQIYKAAPLREKPYKCSYCPGSFSEKSTLMKHLDVHSSSVQFECKFCKRVFSRGALLKRHIRTHTGEKPFRCETCKKGFSSKWGMDQHVKTHTGERPYRCTYCNQSYGQKRSLNIHLMKHTGETPYTCKICDKTCYEQKRLIVHMRLHTGERPYQCEECDKAYPSRRGLSRHISRRHKKPL
ncbi:uncharacterized protein LOC143448802 [Clavelina lepadiformis]|uniref:C2H2-type domain-containing protein n=1 Tax=Clavelina lepadiformis TaxID=159417 RepID=A0ABP0GFU9_CLALP